MNNISGSTLHTKLGELVPSIPSSITPAILDNLCKDDSMQPFLKWFYENINRDNVLSDECIKLRQHIQKNSTWLQGAELDLALAEATKDSPELLKLTESDYWCDNQSQADFTTEKELYDSDFEYFQSIENSLRRLKECEEQIDVDLEKEADILTREEIKVKLIYDNCVSVLEEFDTCHRQFSKAVELLANTYATAAQKKGEPYVWTQIPIEHYVKQLEIYCDYLNSYAKRQFSVTQKDGVETNTSHASFISENSENERLNNNKLICCQKNLFSSKMHEIITKIESDAINSVANYAIEIYNKGDLKTPSTPVLARAETADLTKTRDFLENRSILQDQELVDVVQQYSKTKVVKVLEKEAEVRLERKRNRLLKLERLCTLAKEHGHAFSTLLCMLFELQFHRINEIIQFVIDARHYLSMEYSLSSIRNDSMQKLQNEYADILASSKDQNAFCKAFVDMTALENSKDELQASIQYYDMLRNDNSNKLKILLDDKLVERVESLKQLETAVTNLYNKEVTSGPTHSFKAVPCHIQDELNKSVKQVEQLEATIETIKNKLKTMIKQTSVQNYDREQQLIWQKFLADPESLNARYNELEDLRNHSAFRL